MRGNQPAFVSDAVKVLALLLLAYILILLLVALDAALDGPNRHEQVLALLEVVLSGKALLALLAVGAGVKYEDQLRDVLKRFAHKPSRSSTKSKGAGP